MFFVEPGAALEASLPWAADSTLLARWREAAELMLKALNLDNSKLRYCSHSSGASLAISAPHDQLWLATEINEWAWLSACGTNRFHAPGFPPAWDQPVALRCLQLLSAQERSPALLALLDEAHDRSLPALLDDESLSLGLGLSSQTYTLDALPLIEQVDWTALGKIPSALITGSNGKTTTVRLVAAMLREAGKSTPHNCTDGLYFDGQLVEAGDYSGPAGARWVLRHPQAQAAVVEAARGGMLRRGLAIAEVDAALVTNVSADHFGEYGIHDLNDLCQVKLTVARALTDHGWLVLNADDPLLRTQGASRAKQIAWFCLDPTRSDASALIQAAKRSCVLRDGSLWLADGEQVHCLGEVASMPLSLCGSAHYNTANLAGAAMLAYCLAVPIAAIRSTLLRFGQQRGDNPGRLQHWQFAGLHLFMDYAHNPEGLQGLLSIGETWRKQGRLGLALGQAGNRQDQDIAALADVAFRASPGRIALKDLDGYLRGRQLGDIPKLLSGYLLARGSSESSLSTHRTEIEAIRALLNWAQPGDVLILPVHALSAQSTVSVLLDRLQLENWRCGDPLPES